MKITAWSFTSVIFLISKGVSRGSRIWNMLNALPWYHYISVKPAPHLQNHNYIFFITLDFFSLFEAFLIIVGWKQNNVQSLECISLEMTPCGKLTSKDDPVQQQQRHISAFVISTYYLSWVAHDKKVGCVDPPVFENALRKQPLTSSHLPGFTWVHLRPSPVS